MAYALRDGISFCEVTGRFLFLDLPHDRYFCLSRAGEAAFALLVRQQIPDERARAALERLAATGLLRHADGSAPIGPCLPPAAARTSLLDGPRGRTTARALVGAALQLALVPPELRMLGLSRTLARTARRKQAITDTARGDAGSVVAAFAAIGAVVSAHDRCLPRSIAIARRLIALGHRADLLIGVKLQPFKAHCWVQLGETLVNERREVTRAFTPIVAI